MGQPERAPGTGSSSIGVQPKSGLGAFKPFAPVERRGTLFAAAFFAAFLRAGFFAAAFFAAFLRAGFFAAAFFAAFLRVDAFFAGGMILLRARGKGKRRRTVHMHGSLRPVQPHFSAQWQRDHPGATTFQAET
jgi:hypothetical protein